MRSGLAVDIGLGGAMALDVKQKQKSLHVRLRLIVYGFESKMGCGWRANSRQTCNAQWTSALRKCARTQRAEGRKLARNSLCKNLVEGGAYSAATVRRPERVRVVASDPKEHLQVVSLIE